MQPREPDRGSEATDITAEGIEVLSKQACLRLLRHGGVGCLGLRGEQAPELRPVNFLLRGDGLIVRTGDGVILRAARAGEAAAFEIDGLDRLEHTGWSVLARGKLSELPSDAETLGLPLRPWASGQKDRFVQLSLDGVEGRRIPRGRGNR